ncbi:MULTISPECIES: cyclic pyranopterin monophosphate synthase MoaC [unclassified Halanaerobium]|uniref:cyclic pyranopterin monophosphate synthase MoaC n=1 Tax=unclassified Halanaerobium TaxID=2641197 RepID=UPI000DF39BC5|nr:MULTISPECIES: cyclic pyranopterin monophosphate synthase MoaC [unclassified Halanaerobium]RCW49682.1 cyclic pyranopterin monophosphate synthase subunit MoaC [Halanaerobium sp. MA284_MarDTE_T2]RCW88367.1 cyclic pyranopterin monophosphate synthase subunit MoaC [Halanaerobium sp. DL-01]
MNNFSHIDKEGKAKMVDVSSKEVTFRRAVASTKVIMKKETLKKIKNGSIEKGAVLSTARIAGIMGAKKTPYLIPMCHQLELTSIDIDFSFISDKEIEITCTAKSSYKTGVEMEALIGVSTAALTIYDMCKAVDKGMVISDLKLMYKSGGKSGTYERKE